MLAFPLDPIALFEERTVQMHGWGIPLATIRAVAGRVTDSWLEAPGGWAWEWAQTAAQAESQADWLTAALCYGAARFPTACTPYRKALLRQQLACYLRAAPGFPCRFERRIISVPYRGQQTAVAVHLFSPPQAGKRPLVCLTGEWTPGNSNCIASHGFWRAVPTLPWRRWTCRALPSLKSTSHRTVVSFTVAFSASWRRRWIAAARRS